MVLRWALSSAHVDADLVCRIRKAYRGKKTGAGENLVFDFKAHPPQHMDQCWVTNITYLRTQQGWRYLSVVLDAYSRRAIGYALHQHMDVQLVHDSLTQAIQQRRIGKGKEQGVLVNRDRASQHRSHAWHQCLQQQGLRVPCRLKAVATTTPSWIAFWAHLRMP